MKTAHFLNCLLLLIPLHVVAHPGHDNGVIEAAVAAPANDQLWSLSVLLMLVVSFAALVRIYRRRKSASTDD